MLLFIISEETPIKKEVLGVKFFIIKCKSVKI